MRSTNEKFYERHSIIFSIYHNMYFSFNVRQRFFNTLTFAYAVFIKFRSGAPLYLVCHYLRQKKFYFRAS